MTKTNNHGRFHWYHANGDGTADRFEDTPAICARIDAGEPDWFATPEGAILHGGVLAIAFEQTTEPVFDGAHWFETGQRRYVGEQTVLKITEATP